METDRSGGMKMKIALLFFAFSGFFLVGCNSVPRAPFIPPHGGIYTNLRAPLSTNFDSTPNTQNLKIGTAATSYFRDPIITGQSFAWNRCDIETAAANGGISKVHYADYESMQILGIYGRTTVIVHGE